MGLKRPLNVSLRGARKVDEEITSGRGQEEIVGQTFQSVAVTRQAWFVVTNNRQQQDRQEWPVLDGRHIMEGPLRGLLAGAAAWKFGGGCISTILIFIIVFWLLGYVNC